MTLRNIVKIDEEKCNGCGKCVTACAEGAIRLVNGRAKLISEVYCDGPGACIGHCPQDAITIEQREAEEFDEQAVEKHLTQKKQQSAELNFTCPGMMAKKLRDSDTPAGADSPSADSRLSHWPVQLKLVPHSAPYLKEADLLLVADCVPFAMGDFHSRFLTGRSVVVGCPKLDDKQLYIDKLAAILKQNNLNSLTVIHMEVPCCSGLTAIATEAVKLSGLQFSFDDVTIALKGDVINRQKI